MKGSNMLNSGTARIKDLPTSVTSLILMNWMVSWEFSFKLLAEVNIGQMVLQLSRRGFDISTQSTLKREQLDGSLHGDKVHPILHQALVNITVEVPHVPHQMIGGRKSTQADVAAWPPA